MPNGVGYARHPNEQGDEQVHLWKQSGDHVETYCADFQADTNLNNKGMTQVDKSKLKAWADQDEVCDECIREVAEKSGYDLDEIYN